MARRFAEAGMRVVLSDVEVSALDDNIRTLVGSTAGASLRAAGFDVRAVPADDADADAVRALADAAYDDFGAVPVLCNNAGVVQRARSWELTSDDWTWVLGVDFFGVVHGLLAFVPRMLGAGRGTSSTPGRWPRCSRGPPAAGADLVMIGSRMAPGSRHEPCQTVGRPR